MNFPRGTEVTVTVAFTRKSDSTAVDPDDPRITVTPPHPGLQHTYRTTELTHLATGQFAVDLDLTPPGDWKVRGWAPAGDSVQGAAPEVRFTVD